MNMPLNSLSGIISEKWLWYSLQKPYSLAHSLLEIKTSSPLQHPAPSLELELILVVTMSGVADRFYSIINEMTYWTDFKLVNMFHGNNSNLTNNDLYPKIPQPEYQWNTDSVSYDTFTCQVKPPNIVHLLYSLYSLGMFDKSHQYKTNNTVNWQIMITLRIGFKLQVTAMLGFHLLWNHSYKRTDILSDTTNDPQSKITFQNCCAVTLNSAVPCSIHAIRMDDNSDRHHQIYWTIGITNLRVMWNWLKPSPANRNQFIQMLKQDVHTIYHMWTVAEEIQSKTSGKS